jgi:hypothetical protein
VSNIIQVATSLAVANDRSIWLRLDSYSVAVLPWYRVTSDVGASLTFALDAIFDDASNGMAHLVQVSQAATVITVKDAGPPLGSYFGPSKGHGLNVGDAVFLDDYGSTNLAVYGQGIYDVATVVDAFTYTLTSAVTTTIAARNATARTGKVQTGYVATPTQGLLTTVPWAVRLRTPTVTTPGVARLVVGLPSSPA